ncbi:MAG: ABC transporter permease subunit [Spirochaetaceae bacterium]|nr:ABC transporter permease subunit [Spirochaetaceae bacterium]
MKAPHAISAAGALAHARVNWGARWRLMRRYKLIYLLLLPAAAYFVLFQYGPMYGIQIAFKDFKLLKGIWASEWVGFEHFVAMFGAPRFWQVLRNTVVISVLKLLFGFPAPILFAIMLNELIGVRFKKSVQTISYLPHFISWVVLAGIVYEVLSPSLGIVNQVIEATGGRPHNFMADSDWFVAVVVISYVWQTFGWGSIIYLAALAGIDPQLYEAAQIDGASRLQRTMRITIPSLYPVMVIVFLLRVGNLLEVGFDQIFNLQNPTIYDTGDIIETYTYRKGIIQQDWSYAAAVGLFNNTVGLILLLVVNRFTRVAREFGF